MVLRQTREKPYPLHIDQKHPASRAEERRLTVLGQVKEVCSTASQALRLSQTIAFCNDNLPTLALILTALADS